MLLLSYSIFRRLSIEQASGGVRVVTRPFAPHSPCHSEERRPRSGRSDEESRSPQRGPSLRSGRRCGNETLRFAQGDGVATRPFASLRATVWQRGPSLRIPPVILRSEGREAAGATKNLVSRTKTLCPAQGDRGATRPFAPLRVTGRQQGPSLRSGRQGGNEALRSAQGDRGGNEALRSAQGDSVTTRPFAPLRVTGGQRDPSLRSG